MQHDLERLIASSLDSQLIIVQQLNNVQIMQDGRSNIVRPTSTRERLVPPDRFRKNCFSLWTPSRSFRSWANKIEDVDNNSDYSPVISRINLSETRSFDGLSI